MAQATQKRRLNEVISQLQTFNFVNGHIQNQVLAPHRYNIMQAIGVLDQIGVIEQPKSNFTTNKCAETYLYGVNCVVSSEKRGFSLLENQTDRDYKFLALGLLQNMALKNQQILLYDKFIDPCDPIYNLDDNRPFNVERESDKNEKSSSKDKSSPDLIASASRFSQLNTRKRKAIVKYWANNYAEIIRNKL